MNTLLVGLLLLHHASYRIVITYHVNRFFSTSFKLLVGKKCNAATSNALSQVVCRLMIHSTKVCLPTSSVF